MEKSNRCPRCGRHIWYTRQFSNGREDKKLRFGPLRDPAAIEQCPKCNGRWFAYDQSTLIDVVEGDTSSEVVSSRDIVMDNSKGTTSMTRTKTISQEWSQSYELSVEEGTVSESK